MVAFGLPHLKYSRGMAVPAKPLDDVLAMDKGRLEEYFIEHAGYMEDSPNKPWVIRVSSKSFFSDKKMELRKQFESHVRKLKRRVAFVRSQEVVRFVTGAM